MNLVCVENLRTDNKMHRRVSKVRALTHVVFTPTQRHLS